MSKALKIVIIAVICFCLIVTLVPLSVFSAMGNLKNVSLPDGFEESLSADAFENTADVIIMLSNLLVHYEIRGGLPAMAQTFCLMSYDYLTDMSDHYPIFADIIL